MRNIYSKIFFLLFIVFSCSEEYEQATITFYPNLAAKVSEPGAGETATPYTVELITSRVLADESKVNIRIEGNGSGYGHSYATYPPQLEPGIITLTVPAGENKTSFTFTPMYDGVVEVSDYHYRFVIDQWSAAIKSVGQDVFTFTVTEPPLFAETFNECSGSPSTFVERIVDGAMAATTWGCTDFGYPAETTKATEANAYGKGAGTSNSYLVLKDPLEGTLFDELIVSMKVYSRFTGAGALKIKYSTNYPGTGNPEADGVTWTEIGGTTAQLPAAGSRIWNDVTGSITGIGDEDVYIAFQYVGGTTSSASNWRVDDFTIKAK
jgi:hypothetical protein